MKLKWSKIENKIRIPLAGIFLLFAAFTLPASAATTISIGNFDVSPGGMANASLVVNNVTDFFAANINISYNSSVVIVSTVKQANPSVAVTSNINNTTGSTRIIADGPPTGLSGDIILGNISFMAVGTAGSSSSLGIILNQMIDINGNDIPATTIDGMFNITGGQVLTKIVVSPSTASLNVGGNQTFNATALDQNNAPMAGVNISWTVNNSTVGSISPLFAITGSDGNASVTFNALAAGTAMVNASNGSVTGSAIVTVKTPPPPPSVLTKIVVSPSTASLTVGGNQTFNATALDQNNKPMAGINISWMVSNSTVGSVAPVSAITDANGNASTKFVASVSGTAMVNATNGSVTGSASVIVSPVPPHLTSIVVSPSTASLNVGGNHTFNATALDQNNNPMAGINISWTVSNSTVGSISPLNAITGSDGNVSAAFNALVVGTAMVNATNGSIAGSAIVTVTTPPPHLASIVVSPTTASLTVGGNQQFNATARDQNGNLMSGINISWTVSNSTIGSVTPLFAITGVDGNVSATFNALAPGNSMVNATNESVIGSASVSVSPVPPHLASIVISPSTASLAVGETQKFNATALDQNNNPMAGINISWIVSNSTVGSVTSLFAITGSDGNASTTFNAIAAGTSLVNASNDSVAGSALVTVSPVPPHLASIVVSPATASLTVGGNQSFNATALDQDNKPIAGINIFWTVSNSTVGSAAPVSAITDTNGNASTIFMASAVGTAMVNATNGSVTGNAFVTVSSIPPHLASIIVSPSTASLTVGSTQQFNATARDQNNAPMAGINISWTVNNSAVGNVTPLFAITDSDGNASVTFSASSAGTATVNATNGSVTGSASVTVSSVPPHLASIIVSPSTATLNISGTQVFTATALDQNNKPMAGVNLSWTSSNMTVGTTNPSSATTDMNGTANTTFTALVPGTTMVIAMNGTVSGSTNVTVILPPPVNGTIAGTVTNASSGMAIPGANVTADGMAATTSTNGSYSMSIAAGMYNVTASATGYQSNTTTGVVVTSGNVTTLNFSLTPVPPPVSVLTTISVSPSTSTLNVSETQMFTATALDQNGHPMPGVNLSWTSNNMTVGTTSPSSAMTDMNGTATTIFTALAPGTSTVTAMNGTVSGTANVTVTPPIIVPPILTTISVSPSTSTLNVSETQMFTATALDQNGHPMPGVNINWISSNMTVGTVSPPSAMTDMNGIANTTFTALALGTATVTATNGTVSGNSTVTVTAPPIVPPAVNGSISGSVINVATGTGIPNVTIRLVGIVGMDVNTRDIRMETMTDTMGNWMFSNLPAGRYIIIEQLPKGFIPVEPPVMNIMLEKGQNSMNNNFADNPVSALIPSVSLPPPVRAS